MHRLSVRFREEAVSDLVEVLDYLIEQGADPGVALGFVDRIRKRCEAIGELPEGYPARPDLGPAIRIAPFERSAVIAYRVLDAGVEIVNVFYGGRDYEAILRG
ncbi:plasmid stabilization protein [Devosia insulae DS-56]|uniref:Plasmid stabilization protein n=1 Tax=Devosia insulae DS-56 TaxID=1116389 RepID=A0A1E5XNT8_9HYPH|nr:type II toxin-antitoxin system RelE/ParE family toxin [Devosia insulae]OEO30263.1 plasmid stabilization protein [Devosia insulae DS-56]